MWGSIQGSSRRPDLKTGSCSPQLPNVKATFGPGKCLALPSSSQLLGANKAKFKTVKAMRRLKIIVKIGGIWGINMLIGLLAPQKQ